MSLGSDNRQERSAARLCCRCPHGRQKKQCQHVGRNHVDKYRLFVTFRLIELVVKHSSVLQNHVQSWQSLASFRECFDAGVRHEIQFPHLQNSCAVLCLFNIFFCCFTLTQRSTCDDDIFCSSSYIVSGRLEAKTRVTTSRTIAWPLNESLAGTFAV